MRILFAIACVVLATSAAAARGTSALAHVEVAFTPGDDIEGLIVRHIDLAHSTVQVQAYLFTDRHVAAALVGAMRRGVGVELIGDATQQEAGGLPLLGYLRKAGAHIYLNDQLAASHNKIVIVDAGTPRATVITGSYNFTRAAQSRNAENVVLISGNRAITDRYLRNFALHRDQSRTWP